MRYWGNSEAVETIDKNHVSNTFPGCNDFVQLQYEIIIQNTDYHHCLNMACLFLIEPYNN